MNTKRLFDAVTHQLENFPKNDMLAAKGNGKPTVQNKYRIQLIN